MDFDAFLREACPPLDLQWRKYRRRAARHRVQRRMRTLGAPDYAAYLEALRHDPEEADRLADLMRITVSRFFREGRCWLRLAASVLPALVAEASPGQPLRAWSIGCCGGEEPYTLALLWRERFAPRHGEAGLLITAADIDDASLARAREACYTHGSLREVPEEYHARWFRRHGARWCLLEEAKSLVTFERGNLMAEPPAPAPQDIVLCRYLAFTYYRGEKRLRAAKRLARTLRPGGVLFIGRKEGLGALERKLFEPWFEGEGIYRRNP